MSRMFWLIGALILLGIAGAAVYMMENTADVEKTEGSTHLMKVSTVSAGIGEHAGMLRSLAEVKPRWSATLKAHVGGEVVEVSDKALAGEKIEKGDVLVRLEDSAYKARLADAKRDLAQAELSLSQEDKKAKQALRDWKRSGLKSKPSDIALNKPQLGLAKKAVEAAKAGVEAAEKDLAYTVVEAPFSGVVTERFVSIGQSVHAGDDLVHVLDQGQLDITVSLSARHWENLAKDWVEQTALVKDDRGKVIAQAEIKRGGGFLDPQTRQYKVYLEVLDVTNSQALAGEFVHVELPGRVAAGSLLIPESAYTREGTVWHVDTDNRLRYFESEVLFYQGDHLIVSAPIDGTKELLVITAPLASFVAGKEVSVIEGEER